MAVAKALGARRILAIDVQPNRLDFAKGYVATDAHLAISKEPGEDSMSYSKRHVSATKHAGPPNAALGKAYVLLYYRASIS